MAHITLQEYCWLTDLIEKWRKLDPELQLPTYLYIVKRPHAFQKEGTILKIHGPFCSWPLEAPSKFIPVLNNLILYYYVIVSLNHKPVTVLHFYTSDTVQPFQMNRERKWSEAQQNQQNELCAQRRFRLACASAQSDQSLLYIIWVA